VKVIGNLTKDAIIRAAVSEGLTVTQVIGSATTFESAATELCVCVYDSSNQKIVIGYADAGNNSYGTAVVGTVSGTSISFGTPVAFTDKQIRYLSGAYDSNAGKVVFSYAHDSNKYGTGIVGTVSGTSISFGSDEYFESAAIESTSTAYDVNAQKIVVAYRDEGNSNYSTAVVGTVSGTSITYGTPVVFQSSASYYYQNVYDANAQKVVIGFRDDSSSDAGAAIVGTVSGTSISFGSKATFESGAISRVGGDYDTVNQKIVFAYRDGGNSGYGTAVVGTVSGTSISFGTPVVFIESNLGEPNVTYDVSAKRFVIGWADAGNSSKGTAVVGEVSGTSISFDSTFLFIDANNISSISTVYDSAQEKVVFGFRNNASSNYGQSLVYKTGYTSATGGTIADGKPVIVNANGTVSTVSESAASVGSTVTFNAATSTMHKDSSVYDSSNNKVVMAFNDGGDSNKGKAFVVTVDNSDNSMTFGSEVVFEVGAIDHITSTFDSNSNKVVIAYQDYGNSRYGTAVVGTVSGTSISFGSPVVFESAAIEGVGITFDSNSNKVVISYCDIDGGQDGTAIVGTVSGTSISFGTAVKFEVGQVDYTSATFDTSNNKVVISFFSVVSGNYLGRAVVGTVSGTSISFGTVVTFASDWPVFNPIVFDSSNNKVVIAYRAATDGDKGKAIVGTVSGTDISFGSAVVFDSGGTGEISIDFDTNSNKVVIVYQDTGNTGDGTALQGTVSGTSISFGPELVYQTDNVGDNTLVYDSNADRFVVFYRDGSSPFNGKGNVFNFTSTNLTTENFVGFMDGAALDGTNGEILSSCSIARNQTSLTPGQTYFVTPAGALSTTAGSPSVTAGTAISSTELIVKG